MYRFFVEENQIDGDRIIIRGNDVNHIRNVLRMKPGEEICISTGEKLEYHCVLLETGEEEVTAQIRYVQEKDLELPSRITLFQGLPKGSYHTESGGTRRGEDRTGGHEALCGKIGSEKRSVPSEAVERHIGKRSQAGQKDDRSPGSSCHDL